MGSFLHGLWDMEVGLGGIRYFKAAFDGVRVFREQDIQKNEAGQLATTGIAEAILFYDGSFQNFDTGRWATIHEFGHVFDLGKNRFYVHPEGRIAYYYGGYLRRLEGNRKYNYSQSFVDFPEGCEAVSEYAEGSVTEDFAESWAAYHFQGSWGILGTATPDWKPRIPGGVERRNRIAEDIASFQLSVDSGH